MSDIIQLLPDHVANQIAAGEVVQRPASVVKELLENAIDAKATYIKLILKEAGKTWIQVVDDGIGMSVTDARLSFERHATSKIRVADDLFKLNTKGFRGEALASIAAIAHVELKTKRAADTLGTKIRVEGSKVLDQDACSSPAGTSICIKNLFYNIPARRNFLKSNTVELRHIIDEFHRVALSHQNIRFAVYHNGKELFDIPKSKLRPRIVQVFGGKTNEKLVPIEENTDLVSIRGFLGKPEYAKRTRGEQFFFVNNRFIKSPYLNHAVQVAFDGLLKDKSYPSYFIFLDIDPSTVDINIHPTKTEVKFENEQSMYAILRSCIKHSLGQFHIAPVLDFNRDRSMDTPYHFKDKVAKMPRIEVDPSFNPFAKEKKNTAVTQKHSFSKKTAAWEQLHPSNLQFESTQVNGNLLEQLPQADLEKKDAYQIGKKYIATTIKSGMVFIHQHRAHHRILFESLSKSISGDKAASQQLLFPLLLEYNKKEISLLQTIKKSLYHIGFDFDYTNDQIACTAIPSIIKEDQVTEIIDTLLADLELEIHQDPLSLTDTLVASLAKNMAIKTGTALPNAQQLHIVNSLFACQTPNTTPDNKRIFSTLTLEDIDKKF